MTIQQSIANADGSVWHNLTEQRELNPCSDCGLCCQHFRISFYHGELDTQPGGYVPSDLSVQLTPFRACMKGTEMGNGSCCAHDPEKGCTIYSQRPSVCREYAVWDEHGNPNPDCQRLRQAHGLALLDRQL